MLNDQGCRFAIKHYISMHLLLKKKASENILGKEKMLVTILIIIIIYGEYVYSVSKISKKVGRNDNFQALARKLSFLPTELDIFDI